MSAISANNSTTAGEGFERNLEALPQLIPIGVSIILTNGFVFLLFFSRRNLRKAPNYLLLSLAVCDFLNGSLNIVLFILVFIPVAEGAMFFVLVCAVEVSHNFVAITAACHVILITAEKYIAVMRPFKYHVIKTRTMLSVIAGAWLISGLVAAAPVGWFSKRRSRIPIGLILEFSFNVFCLVAVFMVPYVFIIYAHVVMFRKVVQKKNERNILFRRKRIKLYKRKRNDIKCLIIFATMATVFALCWLPWFMLRLMVSLIGQQLITPNYDAIESAAHVTVIARYLASAINPMIYTFFKQDFWRALKKLVLKSSRKEFGFKSSSTGSRPKGRPTKKVLIHSNQSDCVKLPNATAGEKFRNQGRPSAGVTDLKGEQLVSLPMHVQERKAAS